MCFRVRIFYSTCSIVRIICNIISYAICKIVIAMCYTLFFVSAPTIKGHTIPDSVPTPLEMPIRMLAYRGAISRWLTLKPTVHTGSFEFDL